MQFLQASLILLTPGQTHSMDTTTLASRAYLTLYAISCLNSVLRLVGPCHQLRKRLFLIR
jgi:hypothetical protein